MSAVTAPVGAPSANSARTIVSWAQRSSWTIGLVGLLAILLVFTKVIQPSYGVAGIQGLGISILPLGFAAVAQAVAVIAGGIDLSIGSMMALTSVIAATLMDGQSAEFGLAAVVGVLDASFGGAFMHRLSDLRFRPPHEALPVGEVLPARI